jgi:hypothetical protein
VLADQLQDGGGHESFGDAADAVAELRAHLPAGVDVGVAGGEVPGAAAVADLGEHAGHAGLVHGLQLL